MQLPKASGFYYHKRPRRHSGSSGGVVYIYGPSITWRNWLLWIRPLAGRMVEQWQACLGRASNPELWSSVSVLRLNAVLYASCCLRFTGEANSWHCTIIQKWKWTCVINVIILFCVNEIFDHRMVRIGSPSINLLYPLPLAFRDRGLCWCCHWTKLGYTLDTSVHRRATLKDNNHWHWQTCMFLDSGMKTE